MTLLSYPLTHQGMVRDHNEDALVTKHFARPDGREFDLLAVADGMGGHSRGEVASRIALDTLVEYLEFAAWTDPALALEAAFQLANTRVHEAGGGMGTTLVTVLLDSKSSTYWTANVGDSRAYLLSAGRLQALTKDHSAVAARVEAGLMTREESEVASGRNVLLRAIGPDPEVEVDVFPPRQLRPGERLLLCSDGLHSMVRERELAKLAWSSSLTTAPPTLVDAANRAGGRDNISVIVAALESTESTIAELGALPPAQPIHRQMALAGAAAALGVVLVAGATMLYMRNGKGDSQAKTDTTPSVVSSATNERAIEPSPTARVSPSAPASSPTTARDTPTNTPKPTATNTATATSSRGDTGNPTSGITPPAFLPRPTATPSPTQTPTPTPTGTSAPAPTPSPVPATPTPEPSPYPRPRVWTQGDTAFVAWSTDSEVVGIRLILQKKNGDVIASAEPSFASHSYLASFTPVKQAADELCAGVKVADAFIASSCR